MPEIFAQMSPLVMVAALASALVAGFVKGAVGFAMPLILISGLSLFFDPVVAIAGLIFPTVVSNVWQALRSGLAEARSALAEHWRYVAIVCVVIVIVAQFVTMIPPRIFYLILGSVVTALSVIQLMGVQFHVPAHRRRAAEWGVGLIAGTLGGMTGTWGPPTVLYLMALETPKARAMLVQGVVYGLGSLSLLGGHLQSGVLNATTIPFSLALLVPGLIGQAVGFRLGDKLDPLVFRRVTLVVLVLAGLNLIRRGVFG